MAGSRIERLGTIYSRLTGLLHSGAIKENDKPIWYNIYKAFPPLAEPKFKREVSEKEIPQIFYPEDAYRAKFYRNYGSPGIIDMVDTSSRQLSEEYVNTYQELKKKGNISNIEKATEIALLEKGITLSGRQRKIKESMQLDRSLQRINNYNGESLPPESYSDSAIKKELRKEEELNMKDTKNQMALLSSISNEFKAAKSKESVASLNEDEEKNAHKVDDVLKFIKSSVEDRSKYSTQKNTDDAEQDNKPSV